MTKILKKVQLSTEQRIPKSADPTKPIVLVLLLLLCPSMQAQHFKFSVDTITVDTTNMTCDGKFSFRLSFIAKRKGNLYFLYKNQQMGKVGKCPYNYLLSFDEMGQLSRFTLPDSIRDYPAFGEGLFVRNDSLILRTHGSYFTSVSHVKWLREQGYEDDEIGMFDYYWDRKALQWVAIPFADDHIYEDKEYKVSIWSCGEWGTYVRFLSKITHKDYIYRCKYVIKNEQKNGMTMIGSFTDVPIRVFKQTDGYYLITPKSIIRISDPSEGHIYQGEDDVDVDRKHLYSEYTELVTSQSNIYACFMLKKQLYFIMKSASGICVATYQDGTISKVMDIDCNYTPYVYQSYMRDCDSPKDHTLLLLTDRKAGKDAILTVEGTQIHLRYLIYQ